jgi:large conductance mechanosensitive channel
MLRDFRDFIIKGNALQLAIGVILGIAFGALIVAFTEGVIMALVAALIGRPDFNALSAEVNGATIEYGRVLTALLNLILVGGVLFLLVKLVMRLGMRMPSEETDHDVLVQIRDELRAGSSAARS